MLILTACGGGYSNNIDDKAINVENIANKNQFKALAETRGKQPITFDVIENVAYMQGIMDSTIPQLVKNLIRNHPQVNTIIMKNVLGTIDFEATLKAGRLIRDACLTTVVPYLGRIASGGVHFFLGGCKRLIETGGKLGIHTWKHTILDDDGNISQSWVANDFPPTSPIHDIYLDYQFDMGIPEALYWTIADTPFDKMRYLTDAEIDIYNIVTSQTKTWGAPYQLTVIDSKAQINWGAAKFYVNNGIATMHGKISNRTTINLHNMFSDHPETHTLTFGYVAGTISPNIYQAVELGYAIRNYCLTTKISSSSYVTSEAIHSFIAGCERVIEDDATIEVFSWINKDMEYKKNIKIEDIHYQYYDQMGVDRSFYLYQLRFSKTDKKFINESLLMKFGVISSP